MFETDFEVEPYPEVTVTDIEVKKLTGFRFENHDWQWAESSPDNPEESLPQQYLLRLLRTLRGWQHGMAAAASP